MTDQKQKKAACLHELRLRDLARKTSMVARVAIARPCEACVWNSIVNSPGPPKAGHPQPPTVAHATPSILDGSYARRWWEFVVVCRRRAVFTLALAWFGSRWGDPLLLLKSVQPKKKIEDTFWLVKFRVKSVAILVLNLCSISIR